ncbi:MAG: PadR family transcriptional regulator [Candidatus Bathyarchaeia archaeon]
MVDVTESLLRGLERPLILWLLSKKPFHGYGIIKELKKYIGMEMKPSILYPFLHSLEEKGFVVSKWIKENGRNIRYYSLTSKGEILLDKIRELLRKSLKEIIADTGII